MCLYLKVLRMFCTFAICANTQHSTYKHVEVLAAFRSPASAVRLLVFNALSNSSIELISVFDFGFIRRALEPSVRINLCTCVQLISPVFQLL